jgi:phage terminase large subunit GpA-like protein
VAAAFIDSGYLATKVYQFTARRRKRNVFATKGVNTGTLANKGTWQGDKKDKSRCILRTVNVDDAKTIIFNRLRITKRGPGFCHFPDHYDDQHFTKLTNEEKVEKRKRGVLVGYEWIQKGPNEQLDCRAYALGAFTYLNANMPRMKLRLEERAAAIAAAGVEQPVATENYTENYTEKVIKKRKRAVGGHRGKRGFAQRW